MYRFAIERDIDYFVSWAQNSSLAEPHVERGCTQGSIRLTHHDHVDSTWIETSRLPTGWVFFLFQLTQKSNISYMAYLQTNQRQALEITPIYIKGGN